MTRKLPPNARRARPSARALALLTTLLAAHPASVMAQGSWRQHADLARAREATDSFAVMVRGATTGWQRLGWARVGGAHSNSIVLWDSLAPVNGQRTRPSDASDWIMSDEIALAGVQQRSEVRLAPSLSELGLRQRGSMRGTEMRIALDRQADRLRGTALTPSGGATAVPMDVAVPDDAVDDNALTVILPLIRWGDGVTFSVPVVSSGKGTIESFVASVSGKQTVTVPAGTFETWRVALVGPKYALDADVTTAPPYRVVRFGPRGMPMESQLVK